MLSWYYNVKNLKCHRTLMHMELAQILISCLPLLISHIFSHVWWQNTFLRRNIHFQIMCTVASNTDKWMVFRRRRPFIETFKQDRFKQGDSEIERVSCTIIRGSFTGCWSCTLAISTYRQSQSLITIHTFVEDKYKDIARLSIQSLLFWLMMSQSLKPSFDQMSKVVIVQVSLGSVHGANVSS